MCFLLLIKWASLLLFQILRAFFLRVAGELFLVDAGEAAFADSDFSVYDRVIDRSAHTDGGEDGFRIIAGPDKFHPAAIDQEQVAALADGKASDVAAAEQPRAAARSDFQEIVARGCFAAGIEPMQ